MHTVTGTIRVRVLGDAEPLNALDIAWHYDIVITTFQRLSNEGSLGKRSSAALKQVSPHMQLSAAYSSAAYIGPVNELLEKVLRTVSASNVVFLMQIHWLRIIFDEGHMLGASLTITNKLLMAISLRAERRWVMTGMFYGVLQFGGCHSVVLACS